MFLFLVGKLLSVFGAFPVFHTRTPRECSSQSEFGILEICMYSIPKTLYSADASVRVAAGASFCTRVILVYC